MSILINCAKTLPAVCALKRIRPFVNSNKLQMIFSSLIQSYFDYCCVVTDGCGITLAGKIQKRQNRAARVLISASYDISTDILFKKRSWIDLQSQRKIAKLY